MSDDGGSFEDAPISERARELVHALGWRAPTPIQVRVLPQLAMGRDVIGRAQTGSGKTAAYGLWLTDEVKAPDGVQALVLAPTRELVAQIASDLNVMAQGAPFRAVAVYGGVPYEPQLAAMRAPETTCIVATTGRLLDLLARKQVLLDNVRIVILDEADRMLDMGFLPEVERVLKMIPGARQTALFTATMPKKVAQMAHKYMAHAREIEVGAATPESAEHFRVDVPSQRKLEALVALLARERPRLAVVFARTREGVQRLAEQLRREDVPNLALHGDLLQPERERVVLALRAGEARVVIATDVAARGLDIAGITHVVNYDVPEEAEQYVHRAGRTARAGREGRVFTLATEADGAHVEAAERAAKTRLQPYALQVEGGETLTRAALPPRVEMRGGYARGVRRKKEHTPPRPVRVEEDAPEAERGPEHALPRSRKERRRADDERE